MLIHSSSLSTGVLWPSLYLKKKHYGAQLWEGPDEPKKKLKIRGLVAVRNDWSFLTKRLANVVLDMSIRQGRGQDAFEYLRQQMQLMRRCELPIEDFAISKELHSFDPKSKSAHSLLAKKLRDDEDEETPVLGSKVVFAIVKGPQDLSERAQLLEKVDVREVDIDYYFQRQVFRPLTEILGGVLGDLKYVERVLANDFKMQQTIFDAVGAEAPAPKRGAGPAKATKRKKGMAATKDIKAFFK